MVMDYPTYEEKSWVRKAQRLRLGTAVDTDWYQHGHQVILTHSKGLYRQKSDKTNALTHALE